MKKHNQNLLHDRRSFIKGISFALGASALGMPLISFSTGAAGSSETGSDSEFETVRPSQKKLGVALVGLGSYSTHQLAPALQDTEKCHLAGIVTGTPSKAEAWKRKYNIPDKNIYNYDTMQQIKGNPDIDIIYIVLPNGMHAEYTIKAAETGKHVICEKPMATSVEDCKRMIDACNRNNVKLSIGYRLHFEPHHQRVMELGQQKVYGAVNKIEAADSFVLRGDPTVWRLDKELAGGGPLMDLGIYCVQGAIYTLGNEPSAVTAKFGEITRPDYFDEVEQSIDWQMHFQDGAVAYCSSSYNDSASRLYGKAKNGWWELQPSFGYSGIKGRTSEGPMNLPNVNQQARQMDAFAECILENKESRVPGEMGMRDVNILMAIYEAARTGKKVQIS
ncbi:Gfo/Idh/MocA family protein [Pontibacter locisalis]|uniref:Gfo/Idh/MocA family protein n=1 Tax=Pontibacter locisalis TaxID=1719035 RepID=A0ABW5IQW7_9BACT